LQASFSVFRKIFSSSFRDLFYFFHSGKI
jgi:hypothetical protein